MQKTARPERRPPTRVPTERTQHDAELVDSMDDLLDAIDEVLEDNALEVVQRYRQKSGE
jgi:ubiquitin-like protein Pup